MSERGDRARRSADQRAGVSLRRTGGRRSRRPSVIRRPVAPARAAPGIVATVSRGRFGAHAGTGAVGGVGVVGYVPPADVWAGPGSALGPLSGAPFVGVLVLRPGGSARGGASPPTTDGDSAESPIRSRVRRLTLQVSAAVITIPSTAATAQRKARRVTARKGPGGVTGSRTGKAPTASVQRRRVVGQVDDCHGAAAITPLQGHVAAPFASQLARNRKPEPAAGRARDTGAAPAEAFEHQIALVGASRPGRGRALRSCEVRLRSRRSDQQASTAGRSRSARPAPVRGRRARPRQRQDVPQPVHGARCPGQMPAAASVARHRQLRPPSSTLVPAPERPPARLSRRSSSTVCDRRSSSAIAASSSATTSGRSLSAFASSSLRRRPVSGVRS